MQDLLDTGQWQGFFKYGNDYGEFVEGKEVEFRMFIEEYDDGQFPGRVIDWDGIGANGESATITGFLEGPFISFIKQYPVGYQMDEWGACSVRKDQGGFTVEYQGSFVPETEAFEGTWEICLQSEASEDELFEEISTGTWRMLRINLYTMKLKAVKGDITRIQVDAIVNAANSSLLGGGGVDGAIHRVGGPTILEECRAVVARQGGCETGEAVITTAGNLPAKFVIHTVGPVWHGGTKQEKQLLADCYKNSLALAAKHACKSIAFPNISTGVYGFPKLAAAVAAVAEVRRFQPTASGIEEVIFVCFDHENLRLVQSELDRTAQ